MAFSWKFNFLNCNKNHEEETSVNSTTNMTQNLKAAFEEKIADQTKDHTIEEVTTTTEVTLKNWKHTGNSGGTFSDCVIVLEIFQC